MEVYIHIYICLHIHHMKKIFKNQEGYDIKCSYNILHTINLNKYNN
jgi:hypothetical protein